MADRIQRVNSLIGHELAKIIQKDFDFPGVLVTLTSVDSSANLIQAKVYISVLPEEKADFVLSVLNKGVYVVQKKINRLLRMRPVPKIIFVKEKQLVRAGRIEELLDQLKKEEK